MAIRALRSRTAKASREDLDIPAGERADETQV
jgi:hypothetical protein